MQEQLQGVPGWAAAPGLCDKPPLDFRGWMQLAAPAAPEQMGSEGRGFLPGSAREQQRIPASLLLLLQH